MNEIKKSLYVNCFIAEEAYKRSVRANGEHAAETVKKQVAYESLLKVIEDAGEFEEYRGFRIMVVLRYAMEGVRCRLISA